MTAVAVQVTIDCADPTGLARFWSQALHYEVQFEDPKNDWGAAVDPDGVGPRVVFQRVPEPKTAKLRSHLDLQVGQVAVAAELERLVALGATVVRELVRDGDSTRFRDSADLADTSFGSWRRVILADPEGNEFCLQ